jgi:hypothetical protein
MLTSGPPVTLSVCQVSMLPLEVTECHAYGVLITECHAYGVFITAAVANPSTASHSTQASAGGHCKLSYPETEDCAPTRGCPCCCCCCCLLSCAADQQAIDVLQAAYGPNYKVVGVPGGTREVLLNAGTQPLAPVPVLSTDCQSGSR